jgi:hypothetical protein
VAPAPSLKPGEKAEILFAAEAPRTEKDDKGKPALASLEPIAFLVNGQFRECYAVGGPANAEGAVSKSVLGKLNLAYTRGRRYPVWWRGAPWGEAEAVHSCMDQDLDLTGCFRLHSATADAAVPRDLNGIAFTGELPEGSHPALRMKASPQERGVFLDAAVAAFAEQHVHTLRSRVHLDAVWKTQLRANHDALAGNALVQIPTGKPRIYRSYRLFLVLEEEGAQYRSVLASFHKTRITLDSGEDPPKAGQEMDEENGADKELFFDNFPLFAGEPDAVISRHTYYEDWNFSVHRRIGAKYQLVYSGCGGGA